MAQPTSSTRWSRQCRPPGSLGQHHRLQQTADRPARPRHRHSNRHRRATFSLGKKRSRGNSSMAAAADRRLSSGPGRDHHAARGGKSVMRGPDWRGRRNFCGRPEKGKHSGTRVAPCCRSASVLYSGAGATWRSGDAADCKSAYPGSIPGVASTLLPQLRRQSRCELRRASKSGIETSLCNAVGFCYRPVRYQRGRVPW